MEYLYCKNDNFQDFASGRVLYGGKGIPNFLRRLLLEIFGRSLAYSNKKEDLVIIVNDVNKALINMTDCIRVIMNFL